MTRLPLVGNYLHVGVLGHADDAAIMSHSAETMSKRLSKISTGSRKDADMNIHPDKTVNMIVERQAKIKPPSVEDIKQTDRGKLQV